VKASKISESGLGLIMRLKSRFALLFAAGVLAACVPARASLGGDMASVRDDQTKLQGSLQSTAKDTYTVHEIQAASGVVVREYIATSGAVFGVTWQGRVHPNLRQVLGAYYDQFVQAVQAHRAKHPGLGPVITQLNGLEVETGGHMKSLFGRVYLTQSVPAGMRVEDIR
jgi:hypothetical protein